MEIRPDKPYTAVVALKVASLLPLSSSHFTLRFDAGRIQNQVSQLDLELRRFGHRLTQLGRRHPHKCVLS
jgi:hypothetical protein